MSRRHPRREQPAPRRPAPAPTPSSPMDQVERDIEGYIGRAEQQRREIEALPPETVPLASPWFRLILREHDVHVTPALALRLEWLTRRDWWGQFSPAANPTELRLQEQRADEQAQALSDCDVGRIPTIVCLGERARHGVTADKYRRTHWAGLRGVTHRLKAVWQAAAKTSALLDRVVLDDPDVRTLRDALRAALPGLKATHDRWPADAYRDNQRGRPARPMRTEANDALITEGVPYEARQQLLRAWLVIVRRSQ